MLACDESSRVERRRLAITALEQNEATKAAIFSRLLAASHLHSSGPSVCFGGGTVWRNFGSRGGRRTCLCRRRGLRELWGF